MLAVKEVCNTRKTGDTNDRGIGGHLTAPDLHMPVRWDLVVPVVQTVIWSVGHSISPALLLLRPKPVSAEQFIWVNGQQLGKRNQTDGKLPVSVIERSLNGGEHCAEAETDPPIYFLNHTCGAFLVLLLAGMWRKPAIWTLGGRLCSGPKLSVNCCMLRASARAGACWNNVTLTQPHSTPTPTPPHPEGGKKFWCPFFNLHAYRLVTKQASSHEKVIASRLHGKFFIFRTGQGALDEGVRSERSAPGPPRPELALAGYGAAGTLESLGREGGGPTVKKRR